MANANQSINKFFASTIFAGSFQSIENIHKLSDSASKKLKD